MHQNLIGTAVVSRLPNAWQPQSSGGRATVGRLVAGCIVGARGIPPHEADAAHMSLDGPQPDAKSRRGTGLISPFELHGCLNDLID